MICSAPLYLQRLVCFVVLLTCVVLPLHAVESVAMLAANVILSKGSVTATGKDGGLRTLKRRSKVFSGDVIKTGANGSVQLRFIDKALMTIKASSEMNISSYVLGSSGVKEQALMRLVKGGFRTITGAIGKGVKSAYQVYTPAASVGIRGTNYEVQQEAGGSFVMAVYNGGITVANDAGSIDLGLGSGFNFTRVSAGEAPKGLLLAPASLNVNAADSDDDEESEETSGESDEDSEQVDDSDDSGSDDDSLGSDSEGLGSDSDGEVDLSVFDEPNKPKNLPPVPTVIITSPFPPPYNSPPADIPNPFPHTALSNEEWNLLYSKQFGAVDMQLHYSLGADGAPSFKTQLLSPNALNVQNFLAFDFSASGQDTYIDLNYTTLDTSNNTPTFYTPVLYINVDITSAQDLADHLNSELSANSIPIEVVLLDDPSGQRFVFQPISSSSDFITHMELDFGSSGGVAMDQLVAQLGGSSQYPDKDWLWHTNTYLNVGDGSWRDVNNTAIGGYVASSEDSNGDRLLSSAYVATVENAGGSTHSVQTMTEFNACASNNEICDIQIDEVAAANNIRWGAWFARPDNAITDTSISSGSLSSSIDESNLRFGLLAERANVSDLKGEAVFSSISHTDCSDFSQCIGFSDDGLVSSLTGSFDVDFHSGYVTNGELKIETMGPGNEMLSSWDVNFSGHIYVSEYGEVIAPEFNTDVVSGTVNDTVTNTLSNEVIGTVGGIFASPGDIFAGGYNLTTDDNTNKHVLGVFTLEKE